MVATSGITRRDIANAAAVNAVREVGRYMENLVSSRKDRVYSVPPNSRDPQGRFIPGSGLAGAGSPCRKAQNACGPVPPAGATGPHAYG